MQFRRGGFEAVGFATLIRCVDSFWTGFTLTDPASLWGCAVRRIDSKARDFVMWGKQHMIKQEKSRSKGILPQRQPGFFPKGDKGALNT